MVGRAEQGGARLERDADAQGARPRGEAALGVEAIDQRRLLETGRILGRDAAADHDAAGGEPAEREVAGLRAEDLGEHPSARTQAGSRPSSAAREITALRSSRARGQGFIAGWGPATPWPRPRGELGGEPRRLGGAGGLAHEAVEVADAGADSTRS